MNALVSPLPDTGSLGGEEIDRILSHLEAGGVLAYPTETVYGLGGDSTPAVVERIRLLKGRGEERPFLLLLPEGEEGGEHRGPSAWGLEWSDLAYDLAEHFWPGPLTLVLPDPASNFPPGIRSPEGGVAVRVSSHPFVRSLMERWKRPLISTSANRSGESPARTSEELRSAIPELFEGGQVWIVDGGRLPPSEPSTLIDLTAMRPRLLRRGAIPMERLTALLPELRDE